MEDINKKEELHLNNDSQEFSLWKVFIILFFILLVITMLCFFEAVYASSYNIYYNNFEYIISYREILRDYDISSLIIITAFICSLVASIAATFFCKNSPILYVLSSIGCSIFIGIIFLRSFIELSVIPDIIAIENENVKDTRIVNTVITYKYEGSRVGRIIGFNINNNKIRKKYISSEEYQSCRIGDTISVYMFKGNLDIWFFADYQIWLYGQKPEIYDYSK